jgi:[acyl-carrier-protein] S-malonyltransferase
MGREILAQSAAAKAAFGRAASAYAAVSGGDLAALVAEGPEDQLTLTANAQPAIVAVSVAILEALRERIPNLPAPAFAAGHSLGEYSALVAAGALRLEDAVKTVYARGKAMQEAVPAGTGAMAAIMGLSPEQVAAVCDAARDGDVVSPANFNAPGQIVIAGSAAAVARAVAKAGEAGGKAIPLKVSAPFHCALMAPAGKVVGETLDTVTISPLTFPVVANVDATPNGDAARVKELLVRQVDGAVRWEESIRHLEAQGVTLALEIGPGKVLAGLVKRITKSITVISVNDVAGLEAAATALAT